jgi:hypothetical protein
LAPALKGVTASSPQLAPLLSQPEGYTATGNLRILAVRPGAHPMVLGVIATRAPAGVTLDQLAKSRHDHRDGHRPQPYPGQLPPALAPAVGWKPLWITAVWSVADVTFRPIVN